MPQFSQSHVGYTQGPTKNTRFRPQNRLEDERIEFEPIANEHRLLSSTGQSTDLQLAHKSFVSACQTAHTTPNSIHFMRGHAFNRRTFLGIVNSLANVPELPYFLSEVNPDDPIWNVFHSSPHAQRYTFNSV